MPVLRFARDHRGYESTYLVGTVRAKGGGQTLLYWFRTPPHVKIGRAAFDEEAIRLLEEQHPDIEFDWDRILAARPPAPPEPRETRYPRGERRPSREGRREERGRAASKSPSPTPSEPIRPEPAPAAASAETPAPEPSAAPATSTPGDRPAPVTPIVSPIAASPDVAFVRKFVRVFDRIDEPPHPLTEPSAAERLLGTEKLTILRARYAELQARITARGGDPKRVEALREQAERANPDVWVTEAEVTAGLASVDQVCADLHRVVGRRRRRRRRGGRRADDQATSSVAGEGPAGEESGTEEGDAPDDSPQDDEPDTSS